MFILRFVDHVDVKVRGKVRRSRIYYIRKLRGKAARISSRYVSSEELKVL